MKKLLIVLLALFCLNGCYSETDKVQYNPNDSKPSVDVKFPSAFGELDLTMNEYELEYRVSKSWQMSAVETDNGIGVVATIPYDNYDFGLVIASKEVEESVPITNKNFDEVHKFFFEGMDEKIQNGDLTSYVEIANVTIGNNIGIVLDVVANNVQPARALYFFGNGRLYSIIFLASERNMTAKELEYAFDYFESLKLNIY